MFLKDKSTGDLVEVLDMAAMIDPSSAEIEGRYHAGEELQDPDRFVKKQLAFPSGEELPRCWMDVGYREGQH